MEGKLIGEVSNFFEHVSVAAIKLTGNVKLGATIRIVGGDKDFTEIVDSMQLQHKNVTSAKKGDEIGIRISDKARKGYKVYLVK
ncbi:MAG: hypothetical protein WC438_03630 [Candidatus Pacearchaeota archaeon]